MPVSVKTQIGIVIDEDYLKKLVAGDPLILVHNDTQVHVSMDEATRATLHSDEPVEPAE